MSSLKYFEKNDMYIYIIIVNTVLAGRCIKAKTAVQQPITIMKVIMDDQPFCLCREVDKWSSLW